MILTILWKKIGKRMQRLQFLVQRFSFKFCLFIFKIYFKPPTPVLSEQTFFNNKNCGNNKCQNLLPPELPSIKSKQSLSNESCVNLAVHKRGRSGLILKI